MRRLEHGLIVQPDPHIIAVADDVGANLDPLLEAEGMEVGRFKNSKDRDELLARIRGVHGVVTRTSSNFRDEGVLIESGLVVIQGACKGPHVNINIAKKLGMEVLKADANAKEVAALFNAALYGAATGFIIGGGQLRRDEWNKKSAGRGIFDLRQSTLGVIGVGDVGEEVIRSMHHGVPEELVQRRVGNIIGFNHRFELERSHDDDVQEFMRRNHVLQATSIDEVFDGAQIVTIHVDVTDSLGRSNYGMITEDRLRKWGARQRTPDGRPRAVWINLARGELAPDINTLNGLLHEEVLHTAIVDAHPAEMEAPGGFHAPNPLHPGLHFTPHIGGSGDHIDEATGIEVARTLTGWVSHGGHNRKSRIYVHQNMNTREVNTPGALLIRAARTTDEGSDNALKHGIRKAGFSLIHPGVTLNDRIPGTRDDIGVVPTVLAVNINGTSSEEACKRIAEAVDQNNAGGTRVIALRFMPTNPEMREGVRAYANRRTY